MILWTIALLAISIMTTSSVNPGYDEFGNENSDNIRDVGWFLDFNYHGMGYGSEAARAMKLQRVKLSKEMEILVVKVIKCMMVIVVSAHL